MVVYTMKLTWNNMKRSERNISQYILAFKYTCQPYKICCRTAYITAAGFLIKKKYNGRFICWKGFSYILRKQTKNFSPFWCKRPFYHRKEVLKAANSTSKGFASNPLQMVLLTKEKAEKRKLHWNNFQWRIENPVKDLWWSFYAKTFITACNR